MGKYIDFEELERLIKKEIDDCKKDLEEVDDETAKQITYIMHGATRALIIAASIPNIEVVRCKDCLYYSKSKLNNCILMCERRESTDYCSRGVSKDA